MANDSNDNKELHGHVKYRPEFCKSLIRHMAKGYSYSTWGVDPLGDGSMSVSRATLYNWEKEYPEWTEAKKKGYEAGLRFFETLLVSSTTGILPDQLKKKGSRGINLSACIFALKTRFHEEYGEKQTINHTSSDNSMKIQFVEPPKVEKKSEDSEGE